MQYHNDLWLAERLKKNVFNLLIDNQEKANNSYIDTPLSPALIYSKIPTDRIKLTSTLIKEGFNIIDTNVLLRSPISSLVYKKSDTLRVRKALDSDSDRESLLSIAYNGFSHDRFHADPEISNEHASQIKADWVMNYILGKRGDLVLVIEDKKKIIQGFLLLIVNENSDCIIDLIAMDSSFRGKGAGTTIISAIHDFLPDTKDVYVGTQLSNYLSINFYSKLGFKIDATTFMLHKHI